MKTVRTSKLVFSQGSSDKAYEVDLCDVSSGNNADQFVVNFRYGRRGTALREGTKTPTPVSRADAEKIFDSLVVSKLNKGYIDSQSTGSPSVASAAAGSFTPDTNVAHSARHQGAVNRVRKGLADIATGQLDVDPASRIAWRAGELGEAEFAEPMLRLLDGADGVLAYCLTWAIGRCGDESAGAKLIRYAQNAKDPRIARVTTWAALRLSSDRESDALFATIAAGLPKPLQALSSSTDNFHLQQALEGLVSEADQHCNDALHTLYLLSFNNTTLRYALLRVLKQINPRPNVFRGMRQIYKAAEFFQDAQTFGILNLRFDMTRSYYTTPYWGDFTYIPSAGIGVKISKEKAKPDSRIAYSDKTRRYLRLRTMRSLKRVGELGLDDYVEMAMGILLSTQPEHKKERTESSFYTWGGERRVVVYDEYAHLLALLNIAFGASERYTLSGRSEAWQLNTDHSQTDSREEMFPEIWDRHPQALLQLLLESDLAPVQEFAAKAMIEQTDFFEHISGDQLHALLIKHFPQTQALALTIAKARYDANKPDFKLVFLLLDSEYPDAVEQAREWVSTQPRTYASSVEFLTWVVTANSQDVRHWCRTLVEISDERTGRQLVDELLNWCVDLDEEDIHHAQIDDVEWVLLNPLKEQSASLPFDNILRLLAHPEPAVQVVAGRLLLNHEKPAEDIPPAVFTRLLESPVAEVRGVGVELFAQLPTEAIVSQPELVESFCVADEAQVRAGIRPAIAKLGKDYPDFNQKLMRRLVDRLFRKETSEGVHDDLVSLLTTEMRDTTITIETSLNWRLLSARSSAAQTLGVWLLDARDQNDFTVRQWAFIAHNDNLACREWAWQCYRQNPEKIVEFASDALRVTDGDWEDSRQFGFDYFRNQFPESAWEPHLLISICDSVRGDVQTFGRELLSRFFKDEHGEEYLLKLSQHPSANVQLFASNYLERFASGSVERMNKLELYFVTVLSGVNKNRVSKNRITQFLLDEAARSEATAQLVARVFSRQSVTMAITDKSKYLAGMRDLTLQYPQLDMPLQIKTRKVLGGVTERGVVAE